MREITYLEAVREAMSQEMRKNEDVYILGEDIGVYGGAFGVTRGMIEEFGPERVRNTPISEAGILWYGCWFSFNWHASNTRITILRLHYDSSRPACQSSSEDSLYVWWKGESSDGSPNSKWFWYRSSRTAFAKFRSMGRLHTRSKSCTAINCFTMLKDF